MKLPRGKSAYVVVGLVAVTGLILLIVGIALVAQANKESKNCAAAGKSGGDGGSPTPSPGTGRCTYSDEAASTGFDKFLQDVQDSYYELHPQNVFHKTGVKVDEVKKKFKPYDPSPQNLKKITDKAMALLDKINAKKIKVQNLKPREKKALFQVKHFLEFNYGVPYDGNYYAGDFLLGPNQFCWQPICTMNTQIRYTLRYHKPKELNDIFVVRDKMSEFNQTFVQYMANLKYGVKAGMVRSVEECKAGLDAIKRTFLKISLKGPQGVFDEEALKSVLSDTFLASVRNKTEEMKEWEKKYGKSYNETLREYVLTYIGKPVDRLFRYLEFEFSQHCVPSNISSGLASLPLSFVYINGTSTGEATTKKLPTGEPLDGKKAYEKIMPYFTTNNMTVDEVHSLGYKMLGQLYPEVLETARSVTGQNNNDTAKDMFITRLNQSDMFFVNETIPKNESNKNAHNLCSTLKDAEKYCPKRWAAMQRWFREARMVMSMLDPKTIDMFHFNGYKHTTPNCPVKLEPDFNPSSGAQSYQNSDTNCTYTSVYYIPFFLNRPGPKYEEWSVNAHEARPGHHTQAQGFVEHFRDTCGGTIGWLNDLTFYTAFSEGWALYCENPLIARDTDAYKNEPFQKYGMLKWQVWRALRLIVDTGLHYKGFSRQKALDFFAQYAWDTSDGARKEVTRYQSNPGQATAYMIGQLHIIKLRNYAKEKLKDKFNMKDFHFYLLSQGSAPLSYLEESIYKYVECTLNLGKGEGCQDVLYPVAKQPVTTARAQGIVDDLDWTNDRPVRPLPKHFR